MTEKDAYLKPDVMNDRKLNTKPPTELIRKGLVLFDGDGTATNLAREITPRTRKALTLAHQNQLRFGLCTGRQLAQLWNYALPLFPDQAMHVLSGGAQVATTKGEVLWERRIPSQVVRELCELADANGCGFGFGTGPVLHVNQPLLERFETDSWKVKAQVPDSSLADWSSPLLIVNHLNADMRKILDASDLEVNYMIGKGNIPYADITYKGVNKADGIRVWAELNGVVPRDIIGIGDGDNDLPFLKNVGWAVAMGNAYPPVKAIAQQIIGHTDDDGLAIFLEQLVQARNS